jgi:RNA polymerase sigma-70 factor (ECF subfamily)
MLVCENDWHLKHPLFCHYGISTFHHLYSSLPQSAHHNSHSDEELLLRFRTTGDNAWLGLLLQRYTVLLLGVAMKYLKDKDAAQDAVQQIFLKTLTHLPGGSIGNFKGWLYVLMRNHCLQFLRDRVHLSPQELIQSIPAEADKKQEALDREVTLTEMEAALDELGAEQQQCVRAFYLQRKSYQQIMDETGFSFAQVKSYIQNGKRNLKIILSRRAQSS